MSKRRRKTDVDMLKAFLSAAQRETLKRENPFVSERNALIQHLYRRGVMLDLLAQLTGMSRTSCHRIATQGFTNGRRKGADSTEAGDWRKFQGLLKPVYDELKKLLKGA